MYKVTPGPTVAVDCDDTLVAWSIPEGWTGDTVEVECRGYINILVPNVHNIKLLKKLATRGHAIIVWSGGGSDWAEAVVKALDLEEYVEVVSGKLQYFIDDVSDPRKWMGKHGFFTLDGKRINADNIPNIQDDK